VELKGQKTAPLNFITTRGEELVGAVLGVDPGRARGQAGWLGRCGHRAGLGRLEQGRVGLPGLGSGRWPDARRVLARAARCLSAGCIGVRSGARREQRERRESEPGGGRERQWRRPQGGEWRPAGGRRQAAGSLDGLLVGLGLGFVIFFYFLL
jgi:hypothetical protein